MSFNIIGDIHGHYDAFIKLVEKMPKDAEVICTGDMVDRGPQSKEVVEWFLKGNGRCLMGNHEHMLIESHKDYNSSGLPFYEPGLWEECNGG